MTASLISQHEPATGEPSLFDSLSRLVPSELQREYYRVLAHTRSLNPEDEMLKILEANDILPCVPATRTRNPHGDGIFFQCDAFRYQPESDTYLCPGEKTLKRKARLKKDKSIIYLANAKDCGGCSLKQRCTASTARRVSRHMFEEALTRMNERATAAVMRLRRSVVEHPFATMKYRILGHPRLLLRGRAGAHAELSLAVMAYNLKRMANVLGTAHLMQALQKN